MNGRLVPGGSCPRRRPTSPAAARCTPRRLQSSRRGPSRLILHPQRTRDPWSGSPGGGPCEALMAAEGILRALPSCWSGTLWGDGGSVAVYRVVGATADAVPTLLGWCAPFPISACSRSPDDGAFTARANRWEPARQDPAGPLPADDRPGRSPCRVPRRSGRRFPRHPEIRRPSHGHSGRTGRLPSQEHVGDSLAVMGCRRPLAV